MYIVYKNNNNIHLKVDMDAAASSSSSVESAMETNSNVLLRSN
jgi:hypothetical protein